MKKLKKIVQLMKSKQQVNINALQSKLSQIKTVEKQLIALREYRNELMAEQQSNSQHAQLMKITTDFVEELDRSIFSQERQLDMLKSRMESEKAHCHKQHQKIEYLNDKNLMQEKLKISKEEQIISDSLMIKPKW